VFGVYGMQVAGQYEVLKRTAPGNWSMCRGADAGQRYVLTRHVYRAEELTPHDNQAISRRVAQLRCFSHPHLGTLVDAIRHRTCLFLVFDPVPDGLLMKRAFQSIAHRPPASETRLYFRQLAFTLKYCHDRGVAHGHIGTNHLLLNGAGSLCLFGVGFLDLPAVQTHQLVADLAGSPHSQPLGYDDAYDLTPPEVKARGGSPPADHAQRVAADLWALGAVLFALVRGQNYNPSDPEHRQVIWGSSTDDDETSVLAALLADEPTARQPLEQVLGLPWVTGADTATSRRQSQNLVSEREAAVPQYLRTHGRSDVSINAIAQYHAAVATLLLREEVQPDAICKGQDLTLRFFGTLSDCARILEAKLGCHVFGTDGVAKELKKPVAAQSGDDITFEALRMTNGQLVHCRITATAVDAAASAMDSISSQKGMWLLALAAVRGSDADVAGLLSDLRRNLGGVMGPELAL
jgi:hypothetical protein